MVTRATDVCAEPAPRAAALQACTRKRARAESLVVDWRATPARSYAVTVRWPAPHAFYTLHGDVTSPLLFVEAVRQALAVLSHEVLDIPLEDRLGWRSARFHMTAGALPGAAVDTVQLRVTHTAVTRRRMGSAEITAGVAATVGGVRWGGAEIRYLTHPPAVYRRLRGGYADAARAFRRSLPPAPAVPPAAVGRARARDVVLAATAAPRRWRLRTDTAHEVLFDHPHDHVPGMVLLEAATQAAQAEAAGRRVLPVAIEAAFHRYVELDQPCWVVAEPGAPGPLGLRRLTVNGVQDGRVVASTTVTTRPLGSAPAT
jgi:2-oxo-3-(phosphooxy)propyl 3-oxoalkanoate synthase